MILMCAWCGEVLGEKEPLDDKSLTHGICKPCADALKAEYGMSDVLDDKNIETIIRVFDKAQT